jgi:hypothetical protein
LKNIFAYLILLLLLGSCEFLTPKSGEKDNGKVLARAGNKYLYEEDTKNLGLKFNSPEDSIALIDEYINNWVRRQLMLLYAEENLPKDVLDIEKQIEDYRESLIIYTYEREYVKQNLDTVISEEELKKSYEEQKANFILDRAVVSMQYAKLEEDSPMLDSVTVWFESDNLVMKESLADYCENHALEFNLNDSIWFDTTYVSRNINAKLIKDYDLGRNRLIVIKSSPFIWYFKINGFKIKGQTAPFFYVIPLIRQMIMNKRKIDLKEDFNDNIYKDAARNNTFEIF